MQSTNPFDDFEKIEASKASEAKEIHMFFDGGSRGNPGDASGAYFISDGTFRTGGYEYLGVQTNNYAEYSGLIIGLQKLFCLGNKNRDYQNRQIKIFGDSKLVIEQMKQNWKVKAENLIPLWKEAIVLTKDFKRYLKCDIEFIHIKRELNTVADKLANISLDTKTSKHDINMA